MEHPTIARQRLLFHDGPDWCQLHSDVREQVLEHLAEMCLAIVKGHEPHSPQKDQESSDDFEN